MTVSELRAEFPQVGYGNNISHVAIRGHIRRRIGQIRTKTRIVQVWRYNTSDVVKALNDGRKLGTPLE